MRLIASMAVIVPAALLLSACGDGTRSDDRMAEAREETASAPDIAVQYPEIPLDARSAVDYQGTYEQSLAEGRSRAITLGPNDSYILRDADGVETAGIFNWYSDNSRILIRNGDESQIYGIADGALYRLADENASIKGPYRGEQAFMRAEPNPE